MILVLRRDGGTIGTTAEQLHCLGRGLYGHGYNRIDVNITKAEAEVETESAGVQKQPPPEGGAAGLDDGIARTPEGTQNPPPPEGGAAGWDDELACPRRENLEMRIRMEIQAGKRARVEWYGQQQQQQLLEQ